MNELPKLTRCIDGCIRVDWPNGGFAIWSVANTPIIIQYSNGERIELDYNGKVTAVYAWERVLKKHT